MIMAVALFWTGQAQAAFVLGATRVVYNEANRDVSLVITNTSPLTYAGQVWMDPQPEGVANGQADSDYFAVTPPLFRIAGRQEQMVRFLRADGALPADRESVFWINVQEIPPEVRGDNVIQFAQRVRIKLFYRPAALAKVSASSAVETLQAHYHADTGELVLDNPSPFSINFLDMHAHKGGQEWPLEALMVLPKETLRVVLPEGVSPPFTLQYRYINDFGGRRAGPTLEVE